MRRFFLRRITWNFEVSIMPNLESELGRRYAQAFEQYANLTQAFVRQWAPAGDPAAAAKQTAELTDTLSRWFQVSIVGEGTDLTQHWNRFAAALGVPSLAPPGTPSPLDALLVKQEQISRRLFELAAECQRLQSQLSLHWASVGRLAAQRFAAQYPAPPPSADANWARQIYAQWIDIAEKAYTEAAHGTEYALLIAKLTNAAHAFKAEQAALMEIWAKHWNLPTRSELDALNLQIKELRQQVRELRKQADP
jgi:hypothetical protein